jgi:hypothetical protein
LFGRIERPKVKNSECWRWKGEMGTNTCVLVNVSKTPSSEGMGEVTEEKEYRKPKRVPADTKGKSCPLAGRALSSPVLKNL